jgi:hypothetical protein
MKLVIEVDNKHDLWTLLEFAKSLSQVKILISSEGGDRQEDERSQPPTTTTEMKLGDFLGAAPNLDDEDFKNHLQETRSEWERPIS